eukprot:SAG31_NODE_5385_length_2572_cov_2.465427_2_plen_55_part_00
MEACADVQLVEESQSACDLVPVSKFSYSIMRSRTLTLGLRTLEIQRHLDALDIA